MADNNNVDLGNLKSRDIGNMIGKQLVELGKDELKQYSSDSSVDYGSLPSKTLPELGKKAVENSLNTKTTR